MSGHHFQFGYNVQHYINPFRNIRWISVHYKWLLSSGHCSNNVSEAVEYSEKSLSKCIGITIETRPDYCLKRHLSDMLSYGCTRLEIGVQSVYEDVARYTEIVNIRNFFEPFVTITDWLLLNLVIVETPIVVTQSGASRRVFINPKMLVSRCEVPCHLDINFEEW